jgi:hypothetical protein
VGAGFYVTKVTVTQLVKGFFIVTELKISQVAEKLTSKWSLLEQMQSVRQFCKQFPTIISFSYQR